MLSSGKRGLLCGVPKNLRVSGSCKPAIEIGDDVVDMLEADRQPHIAFGDACGVLLGAGELRMRG